ncbi:MAG: hypothetical protein LUQ24_02765 [Methanobacterium sp.]|nr:hypothetical protein [Methanobacterium sp.]
MIAAFGAISIFGTYSGINIMGPWLTSGILRL